MTKKTPTKPKKRRRPKRSKGRPTQLNKRLSNRICRKVAKGAPLTIACQSVGISYSTVNDWYRWGCEDDAKEPYSQFSLDLERARALAVERRLKRITESAEGGQVTSRTTTTKKDGSETVSERYQPPQWTADAWVLERTEPELFGRRNRVEHSGEVTQKNMNVNVNTSLPEADAVRLIDLLSQATGAPALPQPQPTGEGEQDNGESSQSTSDQAAEK